MTTSERSGGAWDSELNEDAAVERLPLRRVELLAVPVFWAFFALLTVATTSLDPHGGPRPGEHPHGAATRLLVNPVVWVVVTTIGLWLSTRFSLNGPAWRRRLFFLVLLGVPVANVSDVVSDAIWDAIIQPGAVASGGHGSPRRLRPGPGNLTWLDDLAVYLAALGAGAARGYVLRTRARRQAARRREAELEAKSARHEAHAAELHAQLSDARLESLRRQLDPHFLFNTLHSVSALVERDPRGVRRMIGQLSELLRHSMDDASAPEIPLAQELALLERYVDIMRVRFGDELEVEMRVNPDALHALVPNMILQPLVENAIKHGVEQRAQGGRVEVEATLDGRSLVLHVRDNGEGVPPRHWSMPGIDTPVDVVSGARVGVGLRNTSSRLAQLYGSEYRLTLSPGATGGATVEVRLPYRESNSKGGSRVD